MSKNTTDIVKEQYEENIHIESNKCFDSSFDKNYYSQNAENIYNYYKSKDNPKPFAFPRVKLIEELHEKVEETGFVFIEGPLKKGKTTLLMNYANWLNENENYNINFDTEKINNEENVKDILVFDILSEYIKEDISSIKELYQIWGRSLLIFLINKKLLISQKLTKGDREFIYNNEQLFMDELETKYKRNDNLYFTAFLSILEYFINKYSNKKFVVYFIIRLEDFHKHIQDAAIYEAFTRDIYNYTSDLDYEIDYLERIKLIVTTRTFPATRPSRIVFYINNLVKEEVSKFLNDTLKLSEECISEISDLVYLHTSGHPWFLNRFVELFFINRLSDNEKSHRKISLDIFDNKENWQNNKVFKRKDIPDFLREANSILGHSNIDNNTQAFLNEKKYTEGSFEIYKQNKIINEIGLINFKADEDMNIDILGFGNEIIKEMYISKINK